MEETTKEGTIVSAINTLPANIVAQLAQLADQTKQVEANQISSPKISFKSGVMSYQGNAIKGNTMPVVVVDSCLVNAFYEDKFDPDNPQPPACFAFGTGLKDEVMKPHVDSLSPQSETCATCRHNQWRSADGGTGKGKACKNSRRLALMHADDVHKGVDSIKGAAIALAELSPTSAPNFGKYAQGIANAKQLPPLAVVSQMSCAPHQKNQFEVTWSYISDLGGEQIVAIMGRQQDAKESIYKPYPKPQVVEKPAPKTGKRKF